MQRLRLNPEADLVFPPPFLRCECMFALFGYLVKRSIYEMDNHLRKSKTFRYLLEFIMSNEWNIVFIRVLDHYLQFINVK